MIGLCAALDRSTRSSRKLSLLCLWLLGCSGGDGATGPSTPGGDDNSSTTPPSILTTSLADGVVGQGYSASLAASGGNGTFVWSVIGGQLPAGVGLAGGSGVLAGTPTQPGTSSFTVQVSSAGVTASQGLSLRVLGAPVTVTTQSLKDGDVGSPYADTLRAIGGDGAFTWALSGGSLPEGISLNAGEGVLSGTPGTAGEYPFTVTASSGGQAGSQTLTISVSDAQPARIRITPALVVLEAGKQRTIDVAVTGEGGASLPADQVVLSSSNSGVVQVANGRAMAGTSGTAVILAALGALRDSAFVATGTAGTFVVAPSANDTTARVEVGGSGEFEVGLRVLPVAPGARTLASIQGTVTWNPSALEYLASEGVSASGFAWIPNESNVGSGSLPFGAFDPTGTSTSLALALLRFRLRPGSAPVSVTVQITLAADAEGQSVSVLTVPLWVEGG